jgi:hypothetical protein
MMDGFNQYDLGPQVGEEHGSKGAGEYYWHSNDSHAFQR